MYTMMDIKYTQEDSFMSAEFLDFILEVVISYLVPILELIGVFIVAYGTIKSFIKFIRSAAGCKEDLAVIAEKKANENGFSLSVTRNTKPTLFDPKHPAVTIMTDTYNRLTKNHEKPFVMSGGTYARKLPRAFACGTGMPLPPAPEGLFQKGHGDYHQPDEAISLKRVEMALVIYIKGILEICRKVTL